MASPRFNLNSRTNSDNRSLIMLVYRYPNGLLRFSTGKLIQPKFWNTKLNKAKETSQYPYKELNAFLKKLGLETERILNEYQSRSEQITNLKFKNELNIYLGKAAREKTDLISFFGPFIESRKIKGNSDANIKEYQLLRSILTEFRPSIAYRSIDINFYNQFLSHLYQKGYKTNTVGKHIRRLKAVLNEATIKGHNKTLLFGGFKAPSEDVENIYLSLEELDKIEKVALPSVDLDHCRDWLLILCNTGLRFIDSEKLKLKHITKHKGVSIIHFTETAKDGDAAAIPISAQLQRIIDKHDGFPPNFSNSKLNKAIKEVCQLAGLVDFAKEKDFKLRRYEVVGSHTGRRTYISNKLLEGYTLEEIGKMTGQKSLSSIKDYDHIRNIDSAVNTYKKKTLSTKGKLKVV